MTTKAYPRRRELVLVPTPRRWRRLPVVPVQWLADTPRIRSPRITEPGYRRGCKPGNFGVVYPADPPTPQEILRILDAEQHHVPAIRARNRALIVVLWRAGLRIHEALLLKPHHVDLEQLTVVVLKGKGGKRRTVGIDPGATPYIAAWLEQRDRLNLPADAPLFCTVLGKRRGRPMYQQAFRVRLHQLGERAGVPRRVAPHQLRHALAVELAREGVPMHLIQRSLGHSNLGTTATYLSSIAPQEALAVVHARSFPTAEEAQDG